MDLSRNKMILKNIPYIDLVDGTPLWGATAMILAELLEWMKEVNEWERRKLNGEENKC